MSARRAEIKGGVLARAGRQVDAKSRHTFTVIAASSVTGDYVIIICRTYLAQDAEFRLR